MRSLFGSRRAAANRAAPQELISVLLNDGGPGNGITQRGIIPGRWQTVRGCVAPFERSNGRVSRLRPRTGQDQLHEGGQWRIIRVDHGENERGKARGGKGA